MLMIAVVDYGCGNIFSLTRSLSYIGEESLVTGSAELIRSCDGIILPGVGAFGAAADKLRSGGLADVICEEAEAGKPLLGICLGMQLLLDSSSEFGFHEGLGLIPGRIVPISGLITRPLQIPHMGWNALSYPMENELFDGVAAGSCVYFVHSFCAVDCRHVTAVAEYSVPITAAVAKGNVYGVQFHPEKSGKTGLNILRNFCEVCRR